METTWTSIFFLCYPSPLLKVFPWLLGENYFCISIEKWGFNDSCGDGGGGGTGTGAGTGAAIAAKRTQAQTPYTVNNVDDENSDSSNHADGNDDNDDDDDWRKNNNNIRTNLL